MKSKTIWESASRPLFVRSVWLESLHDGRGVQHRHFILDYETHEHIQQQRSQTLRSSISPVRRWRQSESLRHSVSCDLSELSSPNEIELTTEDQLKIGSAKIKLQQPLGQTRQRLKLLNVYRRPSLTKTIRKQPSPYYGDSLNWKIQEIYSRHSSLQDLQSTLSMSYQNPEERLAERVLNWLDLAGKSELVKDQADEMPIEMLEMENFMRITEKQHQRKQQKSQQQQPQMNNNQRQKSQNRQQLQGNLVNKKKGALGRNNSEQYTEQSRATRHQRDGVKPITIIFNRDGFPVRLNRAARNIDLCTLASSAGTARRLAGSLASARLYHGNETISYRSRPAKPLGNATTSHNQQLAPTRSLSNARPRNNAAEAEKSTPQTTQKRSIHDDNHLQDSKRQLHIFMPSLPKKGMTSNSPSLLSAGNLGDESSISLLSQQFYGSCKL